jgi:hypothetical protein
MGINSQIEGGSPHRSTIDDVQVPGETDWVLHRYGAQCQDRARCGVERKTRKSANRMGRARKQVVGWAGRGEIVSRGPRGDCARARRCLELVRARVSSDLSRSGSRPSGVAVGHHRPSRVDAPERTSGSKLHARILVACSLERFRHLPSEARWSSMARSLAREFVG